MGRYRTAQTWKIIGMFYNEDLVEGDGEHPSTESIVVSTLRQLKN